MTDPTSRALELLGLLQARSTWTGPELAERLGVTPRTLRRDVDRLRGLGYRVEAEPGAAGGYALGRGRVVPPLLLDEQEALQTVLALLSAATDDPGGDAAATLRALGKLQDVLPPALRQQARDLQRNVHLVGPAHDFVVDPAVLSRVAEATRRCQRLRFRYRSRLDDQTQRLVEPHLLAAKDRRWYLLAHDVDRRDWRTFRVDRMAEVERTSWEFRRRPDAEQAIARMQEGMPASAYRHRVEVLLDAPREQVVAELPHAEALLEATPDGCTRMRTGADDPHQAAWWIARLPFEFTVVGDDDVRAAVETLAGRLIRATSR